MEGSTEIEHTLNSHNNIIPSETNSFQKLDYIYQHFQDNEKIHESDPNLASYENDSTLYPHINSDIEYGLFKDVISSYYLDSQIKDDFRCDQNCYTNTPQKQYDQPPTSCTHAYDHITQHINNLEDPTQQHTLYTQEVDASLFTTDTTTLCDYNITDDVLNSDNIPETKSKITQPMGIHSQSKHKYRNVFGDSNIQYHDFDKINIWHYYNKNYKTPTGVYMTLSQPKVTKYLLKWTLRLCHMQCIFLVIRRPLQKINQVPYQVIEYDDKGMFQAKLMDNTHVEIFIVQ